MLSTHGIIVNATYSGGCVPLLNTNLQIGTLATNSSFMPAYGLYGYSVSGTILSASDLGASKQISGLQIHPSSFTVPYTFLNQEIWIGQISNSTFPTSTPQVNFSDLTFTVPLTKVKNAFTYTVSANNLWVTINFDTNFCYNGTNNLLIVWKNYDGSWASGYGTHQVANVVSRAMWAGNDPSYPTGTGTRTNYPLLVKLNY